MFAFSLLAIAITDRPRTPGPNLEKVHKIGEFVAFRDWLLPIKKDGRLQSCRFGSISWALRFQGSWSGKVSYGELGGFVSCLCSIFMFKDGVMLVRFLWC